MNRVFILPMLLFVNLTFAQDGRYIVFFKDKAGTSFSVDNPIEFLSQQSIDRRAKQNIIITEDDFPVNPAYVSDLAATGAQVLYTSRWMNCALAILEGSEVADAGALPFVDGIEYVAPLQGAASGGRKKKVKDIKDKAELVNNTQLAMLGLDHMHADEIDGTGVIIAVFDSGFEGVDVASPFGSLLSEGRIQYMHDFVGQSSNVFQYDVHGTEVLSVMAANQGSTYLGGAFNATYQLFVTEEEVSEYRVEEYNWLVAAEKADSAGVDIINSSLGYNTFDDSSMDYTIGQLDGRTAVVSKAAELALARGILVVVSAGNEGNTSWKYVDPPADVEGVLSVGSITSTGAVSNFSSIGPTADDRIKPEVVALGSLVSIIQGNGTTGTSSGTSVATPLITSLAAGLLQAYPQLTATELQQLIIDSGNNAKTPDNQRGYGLPHYLVAKGIIDPVSAVEPATKAGITVYPNPTDSIVKIGFDLPENEIVTVELVNLNGILQLRTEVLVTPSNNPIELNISSVARGLYLLNVRSKKTWHTFRLVKR